MVGIRFRPKQTSKHVVFAAKCWFFYASHRLLNVNETRILRGLSLLPTTGLCLRSENSYPYQIHHRLRLVTKFLKRLSHERPQRQWLRNPRAAMARSCTHPCAVPAMPNSPIGTDFRFSGFTIKRSSPYDLTFSPSSDYYCGIMISHPRGPFRLLFMSVSTFGLSA